MNNFIKGLSFLFTLSFLALLVGSMLALMNVNRELELKDKLNECQVLLRANQ